jgi:hypothetical protein
MTFSGVQVAALRTALAGDGGEAERTDVLAGAAEQMLLGAFARSADAQ